MLGSLMSLGATIQPTTSLKSLSLSPEEGLGWADMQDVYQRQSESPFQKPLLSTAHWNLAVPFPLPSHQEEAWRVTAE